jgi:superfamily I DNA/RNA helicase|tara:strand:+ start:189 stop:1703 length:1515 start_codon:yes stop_codon:yes gene_type:complete
MFRIFGPPGTGKTTTLLDMVDKALEEGVHPHKIAFLAFTRKAANEARDRAAKRFNLDPKADLPFFRTLHSLALAQSDIRVEQIMQPEDYKELGDRIGYSFSSNQHRDIDNIADTVQTNDPVLNLINLARLRKVSLRKQYNVSEVDVDWTLVNFINHSLKSFKEKRNRYDFTDMLEAFSKTADRYCPNFEITFLDEAQDLSPLQWDIAHALDKKSTRMYVAGDDDQAIFRWAGAEVDHFINLDGGSEILSQSFRIPKNVHEIARKVSNRLSNRFPKEYQPKKEEGKVVRIYSINELNMDEGTWMILAQAGYMLSPVKEDLKSNGYLFSHMGHRSISKKISSAVNGWEQLRNGKRIIGETARDIYSFMSLGDRIKRGFKKLNGLSDADEVSLQELQDNFGLLIGVEMIWHEAMDKLPVQDRAYITKLLRKGEKFNAEPRISVSTIHGSKGGEAENVVLFTDLSPAADAEMRINPNDTHRTFYVGVTRTKQNLYIVEADDATRSYSL